MINMNILKRSMFFVINYNIYLYINRIFDFSPVKRSLQLSDDDEDILKKPKNSEEIFPQE